VYVYRICRAPFRALDGEGARLYGGRWNSPGRPVVYASTTLALAALEYLIHVAPATAPSDLVALTIELPDDEPIERVDDRQLPGSWERELESAPCQAIGDAWADSLRGLILLVPAAPVPEELNALVNPRHAAMRRVRVVKDRPFSFDPRLL
jgi:RES domain-containing protein